MMRNLAIWAVAIGLHGCSPGGGNTGDDDDAPATAYAAATDYSSTGVLSKVGIPTLAVQPNALAGVVSADPVLRYIDGLLYIVNRFGFDNITIVDPVTLQLVGQYSTGNGTNPQDVAVAGDTLYVAALAGPGIVVIDTRDPGAEPELIDLSAYDEDGVPNVNSVMLVDDILYATIQQYDSTFTTYGGMVVVIDIGTRQVITDFPLTYGRPFGLLRKAVGGALLIPTTENFDAEDGCVERITTGSQPASAGCLVENATIGGFVSAIAVTEDRVWLAVNGTGTESKILAVTTTGSIDVASITSPSQQPTDLAVCPTGHIIANDVATGGVRVYAPDGVELTGEALDVGLPPAFSNGLVCL